MVGEHHLTNTDQKHDHQSFHLRPPHHYWFALLLRLDGVADLVAHALADEIPLSLACNSLYLSSLNQVNEELLATLFSCCYPVLLSFS